MNTKERIEDLASMANALWERVRDLSTTNLEVLYDEVEGCEADACELSCRLDDLNDDLEEDREILTDYIPDDLSAGEYDSLKEVLNKWRTDNGYPAK
jgi:hypothetical protein